MHFALYSMPHIKPPFSWPRYMLDKRSLLAALNPRRVTSRIRATNFTPPLPPPRSRPQQLFAEYHMSPLGGRGQRAAEKLSKRKENIPSFFPSFSLPSFHFCPQIVLCVCSETPLNEGEVWGAKHSGCRGATSARRDCGAQCVWIVLCSPLPFLGGLGRDENRV